MASISVRKDTNKLFFNFTYLNIRCREQTQFTDNKTNRKKLEKQLNKMEAEILTGAFSYGQYFPNSSNLEKIQVLENQNALSSTNVVNVFTPLFSKFVFEWVEENKLSWRKSHLINITSIINKHYLPYFGDYEVGQLSRVDIIKFRTLIAKLPGRSGRITLSNNRINKIMDPLKRIFDEASDRYGFISPYYKIKALKTPKTDIQPFNLSEVNSIITLVRPDYKNYYTTRLFTGMRTGEIDGLKWKYVDFEHRIIKVRETIVLGDEDYTKNDSSQRDIDMSEAVFIALKSQFKSTGTVSDFVFCNAKGEALDHNNITKRVWYPLLARLGIEKRRPYQSRHTTATLWLASGESPEWIAKQMGHASTEMLFKVYSRFVPNLTRKDGSAFEKLLQKNLNIGTGEEGGL
jgi:integrase